MGMQNSSLEISKCLLVIQLKMLSGPLVSGCRREARTVEINLVVTSIKILGRIGKSNGYV